MTVVVVIVAVVEFDLAKIGRSGRKHCEPEDRKHEHDGHEEVIRPSLPPPPGLRNRHQEMEWRRALPGNFPEN